MELDGIPIVRTAGQPWPEIAADGMPPLILCDLDRLPVDAALAPLPPCPLVGIGDRHHPLAARLDAVIEPPVSLATLVASVRRSPLAAAALVQLLRVTAAAAPHDALVAESLCYAMLQGSAGHAAWLALPREVMPAPPGSLGVLRRGDRLDLVLDRPAALNAVDRPLRDALHEALMLATLDHDIAEVRLRGNGRCFSIGADLAEFGTTRDPATAHAIRMRTLPALPLIECGERLAVQVHGACVGAGLELAAFAARVTATADAWFQLPELAMGIIPGAGGTVSVPRRIGRQRAGLMMLSGRRVDARTALRWGLVDAIVDALPGGEDGAHSF